jgi:plasmid maintenance system antidote protein VapI
LRLGRFFRTTPGFWMTLQTRYVLETTAAALGAALEDIRPLAA